MGYVFTTQFLQRLLALDTERNENGKWEGVSHAGHGLGLLEKIPVAEQVGPESRNASRVQKN